jgi:hypothetical protein
LPCPETGSKVERVSCEQTHSMPALPSIIDTST